MQQFLSHADYMQRALALAERGRGRVSPNPLVGCIIVKNQQIIGEGWHQKAGGPHAEIIALQAAGAQARGATVYVTLEPCCHYGKTPPCTEALIAAEIAEIYIATVDPNPKVNQQGILQLQQAGIRVHVGLKEESARQLNEIFFHYIQHQQPFVIAKWAMSLDGKTITATEDTREISNQQTQEYTHILRQQVDAILIGSRTALRDNPRLTARIGVDETAIKQPLRLVLTREGILTPDLQLFSQQMPGKTIVVTTSVCSVERQQQLAQYGIDLWILPQNAEGYVDLPALLKKLADEGITSLLVEGGEYTRQDFLRQQLVQKVIVYLAPVLIGGLSIKQTLESTVHFDLADNHCFIAYPKESA